MKREEIAAAQKLELDQLAEQEIAEMRREAKQARERIDGTAQEIAAKLGTAPPAGKSIEPVRPVQSPAEEALAAASAPEDVSGADTQASEPVKQPRETANFADIAANIAGDDWKDL